MWSRMLIQCQCIIQLDISTTANINCMLVNCQYMALVGIWHNVLILNFQKILQSIHLGISDQNSHSGTNIAKIPIFFFLNLFWGGGEGWEEGYGISKSLPLWGNLLWSKCPLWGKQCWSEYPHCTVPCGKILNFRHMVHLIMFFLQEIFISLV